MVFCCPKKTCARVVDGTLVINLSDALTPAVSQLAVESGTTMSVRTDSEDVHTLISQGASGAVTEVASFASRKQALRALNRIAGALQSAHGHMRAQAESEGSAPKQKRGGNGFIVFLLCLIALMGIAWFIMVPGRMALLQYKLEKHAQGILNNTAPTQERVNPQIAPPMPSGDFGVPQSADEFLRQQGAN
ncbi:MAG: hypothetical protein GC136_01810 [Alphaproteobacteria bacterium]|nr:hypothetical protein [Alphaproteobacteria bacterium]